MSSDWLSGFLKKRDLRVLDFPNLKTSSGTRKASSIRFSRFALRSDLAFRAPDDLLRFGKSRTRRSLFFGNPESQAEARSGGLGGLSDTYWGELAVTLKALKGFGVLVSRIGTVGVLFGVGLVGCKEKDLVRAAPAKTVVVRQTGADFQMPPMLWDKLLPSDAAGITDLKTEEEDGNTTAAVNFAPVNVILTEKNPGVLIQSPIKFEFPQGGGVIDLSDWVTGKPGTFFVDFDIEGNSTPEFLTVYYLSRAKKRRFDNSIFGAGCRSFFNIKKHFLNEHKRYGMAVNTTRNLHSTILGGHFLFSWQKSDSFMVTQVQFVDSKNPQLFCDDDKEKSAE